ncbi:hypothetical protein GGTG_07839 [Gaeumannomyces tritici R3-111a-1]|uniref:Uncharacterized protein n=1 Tax=Gaeumannomyces tritici (strain R3-111a-1) TaxID=644352 RepID=J3P2U7_GAET3|nr:hypothetical protein GGTG_07839 [Gaeumannomyces tritici R3-111a-1]EJT73989.1 hypothetical protein GGTG_07839 [Gaeumannomyces tritici R3-111a-1]
MSSALMKAGTLKPEIRLAQKVSEFEAALSDERKATFRSYRSQARASPPDAGDIMRLTAEVDRRAAGRGYRGRCFGPRFSNILQTTQQFAALGDVVVGGSQNIIACGIWSLVRMTLLVVANFHSYFEKLSDLLMAIGRSSPRHEMMALLYPQSKRLQSYLCEYFIVVVNLCHQHLKLTNKSVLCQLLSFPSDSELKAYQSGTDLWASHIKDEVNALMAKDLVEQGSTTKALLQFSKSETHRKKFKAYSRILDACSAYDYQKSWKEIKKAGYTTLLDRTQKYQDWKTQTSSCTLVCTGKLGSGKSVLLANMVGDLSLYVQNNPLPVAYFFCRHDIPDSLQARTIMGCLARQLLGPPPGPARLGDLTDPTSPAMDLDGVTSLLLKVLPPRAYIVVDGLDECDDGQAQSMFDVLRQLQDTSSLLVCVSFRVEPGTASRLRTITLARSSFWQIPDNNPDVGQFISAELERRRASGKLKMGDPLLIKEIEDALVQGAHGMFLWVALQLESLCAAKTDQAIRRALADLPKDLPSTFSRILQKSEALGKDYQQKTLELVTAARRPLTTDELREALSVTPGNTDWNPAQLLNDIHSTLACCGGLVIVDEEDFAVHLVHHSVKQFLLGSSSGVMFTLNSALTTMAYIILTYLNYGVFDTQLSTLVAPQVMAATAPQKIIQSSLGTSTSGRIQEAASLLWKPRKQPKYNIGPLLLHERNRSNPHYTHQFSFLPYAKLYYLHHIKCAALNELGCQRLVLKLLREGRIDMRAEAEDGLGLRQWAYNHEYTIFAQLLDKHLGKINIPDMKAPMVKAIEVGDEGGVQLLLDEGADTETKDPKGKTLLYLAVFHGRQGIVRLLLDNGADMEIKDPKGETLLHLAVSQGCEGVVRLLLDNGADTKTKNPKGETLLHFAVSQGCESIVRLLLDNGVDAEAKDPNGRTPLNLAVIFENANVISLLLDIGANIEARDPSGRTPLHLATIFENASVISLLLDIGANIEARDSNGRTPLHLVAEYGNGDVLTLLLIKGADIEATDANGWTPLHTAAENGQIEVVRLLLNNGANIEGADIGGRRPLHLAAGHWNEDAMSLLLDNGADIEATNANGRTPLHTAAENGNIGMVRLLLGNGANSKAENSEGKRPGDLAMAREQKDIALLLE